MAQHFDEVKEMAGSLQETIGISNEQVLASSVAWDTLRNATIIGDRELELIRHYDVKSPITQDQLLQQYGNEYAGLFLTLVRQINTDDSLQYVLALIDNLLNADQGRSQLFLRQPAPFEPFASILNRATASRFCTSRASKILALLLVKSLLPGPDDIVRLLLHWCSEQLRSKIAADVSVGLSALQVLLRKNEYRTAFFNDDGLNKLTNLLRSQTAGPANSQLLYQAIYAMWLLSYNKEIAAQFHITTAITRIIDTIRQITKVKVIRVGIATLTNLLDKGPNNLQMIEAGCVRVLDNLSQRKKWGDTDLEENIELLSTSLRDNIAEMSSFDMYKSEILSGELDWTPVHRSEKFWRDNINRFSENDNEVLGVLVHLLRNSQATLVLSVACHDLGEFIRFHPRGRQIVTALGAKVSVMKLMTHPDEEVKKQALLCIQKLMVVNWEYLAK